MFIIEDENIKSKIIKFSRELLVWLSNSRYVNMDEIKCEYTVPSLVGEQHLRRGK